MQLACLLRCFWEKTYDCAIADLDWLDNVQQDLGRLAGEQVASVHGTACRSVDFVREEDCRGGSAEVGDHACKTDI